MSATYTVNESVATIALDDGKVNVLSPAMQASINEALDRAEKAADAGEVKAIVLAANATKGVAVRSPTIMARSGMAKRASPNPKAERTNVLTKRTPTTVIVGRSICMAPPQAATRR